MNSVRIRQIGISVAVIGSVLAAVMLALLYSEHDRKARDSAEGDVLADFRGFGRDMDPAAAWVGRSEAALESISRDNAALRRELETLRESMHTSMRTPEPELEPEPEPSPEPVPMFAPPPPPFPAPVIPAAPVTGGIPVAPVGRMPTVPVPLLPEVPVDAGVLVVDLSAGPASAKGQQKVAQVGAYLPAGSFAHAALLTGLDAPTGGVAQSNPVPVLLSLLDGGRLPNRFRHRVEECFVTAAGYGDLAAERAYLRLERLSCVIREGQVLDLELKGYVVGEDGKAGLRGRPVSKQGAVIARALLAGLASGVSEGLSQSLTTLSTSALGSVQSIDGARIAQYGLARGAGTAMEQLARWYLERANELYPIIEIDSGRKVEVVLTQGLDLPVNLFGAGQHEG